MAHKARKTEMKGTGGGRWCLRAEAKADSNVRRRQVDREECEAGEAEIDDPDAYGSVEVNDEGSYRTDPLYRLVCRTGDDRSRK